MNMRTHAVVWDVLVVYVKLFAVVKKTRIRFFFLVMQ
jgi:hypothetical protein